MYHGKIQTLHLEPSQLCNASCTVCNRRLHGGPKNPNIKDVYTTLAQVKKWFTPKFIGGLNRLILCGNYGDPMTNPDLLEIVAYFRQHAPTLFITMHTNASGRSKKWWHDLGTLIGKHGDVYFSIDGLEDTNHIYRRGTRWSPIMDAVNGYISSGASAIWDYLIFRHNEHQVDLAEKMSRELGFRKFIKKTAFGFYNDDPMIALTHEGEFDYFIYPKGSTVNKVPDQYDWNVNSVFDVNAKPDISTVPQDIKDRLDVVDISCMAENGSEIYVNAYGLLFPCCFTAGKWQADSGFVNAQLREFIRTYDEQTIDLNKYELDHILHNSMFIDGYKDSWKCPSLEQGKLMVCAEFCGKYKENTFTQILKDTS